MKKFFIFLGIVVVIILLLNVALFVFINTKGKDVITKSIEENLGFEASIDSLSFKFPFTVEIENFECEDVSFKKASIFLGLFDPFSSRLILNKISIDGLEAKITRDKEGITVLPFSSPEEPSDTKEVKKKKEDGESKTLQEEEEKEVTVILGSGYINNGTVEFVDLTGQEPLTIVLENVNVKLKNFAYPKFTRCHLNLESGLKTAKGILDEAITIDGWIDYSRKNMDADLNLNSIDYTSFNQLYPPFWKPDNLGIEQAHLSLQANLNSKDNDLVIDSILSLDSIEFREDSEEPSNKDLIKTMIALIQGDKEKASLNIKLKTKMDSPELDFSSIKGLLPMSPAFITQGVMKKTKKGVDDIKGIAIDKPVDVIQGTLDRIKGIFSSSGDNDSK